MNLVVNDQTPVTFVKNLEMGKIFILVRPMSHYLIGGQRYRRQGFRFPSILSYLIFMEVGLVQNLTVPLLDGCDAGRQHKGGFLEESHRGDAYDRFPGATRQYDYTASTPNIAPGVENLGRFSLIIANVKRKAGTGQLPKLKRER